MAPSAAADPDAGAHFAWPRIINTQTAASMRTAVAPTALPTIAPSGTVVALAPGPGVDEASVEETTLTLALEKDAERSALACAPATTAVVNERLALLVGSTELFTLAMPAAVSPLPRFTAKSTRTLSVLKAARRRRRPVRPLEL